MDGNFLIKLIAIIFIISVIANTRKRLSQTKKTIALGICIRIRLHFA